MRIISGYYGGRLFQAPHGHRTHPMSDKMRGALFNMIGDISGLTVLDPFAGSGALCFEAVSRGAASALAIERDRPAQRMINENIAALGMADRVKLIKANANAWLRTTDETFDLVLLDPPYDALPDALLYDLSECTNPGGLLVLSWPGKERPLVFEHHDLVKSKSYGDGSLHIYARR